MYLIAATKTHLLLCYYSVAGKRSWQSVSGTEQHTALPSGNECRICDEEGPNDV